MEGKTLDREKVKAYEAELLSKPKFVEIEIKGQEKWNQFSNVKSEGFPKHSDNGPWCRICGRGWGKHSGLKCSFKIVDGKYVSLRAERVKKILKKTARTATFYHPETYTFAPAPAASEVFPSEPSTEPSIELPTPEGTGSQEARQPPQPAVGTAGRAFRDFRGRYLWRSDDSDSGSGTPVVEEEGQNTDAS